MTKKAVPPSSPSLPSRPPPCYKPHKHGAARRQSAIIALRALLPLPLLAAHKRELLGVCLWKITEADGKFNVRFWSEKAIAIAQKNANSASRRGLIHEHVYTRKALIARLLGGEAIEAVAADAVACIITAQEHKLLSSAAAAAPAAAADGWARYTAANIKVYAV